MTTWISLSLRKVHILKSRKKRATAFARIVYVPANRYQKMSVDTAGLKRLGFSLYQQDAFQIIAERSHTADR